MGWINANAIPIEAQYLYRKGIEMKNLGKNEDALAFLKQAVIISPKYGKAIYEIGNCLARMGRYDEAIVKYTHAATVDPSGTASCCGMDQSCCRTGRRN